MRAFSLIIGKLFQFIKRKYELSVWINFPFFMPQPGKHQFFVFFLHIYFLKFVFHLIDTTR